MEIGCKTAKDEHITPLQKMVGPSAPRGYHHDRRFTGLHLILVAILTALCTVYSLALVPGLLQRLPGTT